MPLTLYQVLKRNDIISLKTAFAINTIQNIQVSDLSNIGFQFLWSIAVVNTSLASSAISLLSYVFKKSLNNLEVVVGFITVTFGINHFGLSPPPSNPRALASAFMWFSIPFLFKRLPLNLPVNCFNKFFSSVFFS